jgi:hypothetical protein
VWVWVWAWVWVWVWVWVGCCSRREAELGGLELPAGGWVSVTGVLVCWGGQGLLACVDSWICICVCVGVLADGWVV